MKKEKLTKEEIDMIKYLVYQSWLALKELETMKLNLHETQAAIDLGIRAMEFILAAIFNFERPCDVFMSAEEISESAKNIDKAMKRLMKMKEANSNNTVN